MNVGWFLSKRLLRLGWLLVIQIVLQLGVSFATGQPAQSRTAPIPAMETG